MTATDPLPDLCVRILRFLDENPGKALGADLWNPEALELLASRGMVESNLTGFAVGGALHKEPWYASATVLVTLRGRDYLAGL